MAAVTPMITDLPRMTSGFIDRIEQDGVVFVREDRTNKLGFIENTTPIEGTRKLRRGMHLSLHVRDEGNVMVVETACAD